MKKATKIAKSIDQNVDNYWNNRIDYATFTEININLWNDAKSADVTELVQSIFNK